MNVSMDKTDEMLEVPVAGTGSSSRHAGDKAAGVPTTQESIVAPLITDFGDNAARVSSTEDVATIQNKVKVTTPSRQGTSLVVGSPLGLNTAQAASVLSTVTATNTNAAISPSPPVPIPAPGVSGALFVAPIFPAPTGNPAVSIKPKKEESLKEFQLAMLKEHNSLRIRHESKLLDLDANLNSYAASYARRLAQKPPVKGAYRLLQSGIGQNTYSHCGKSLSGADVTSGWYNEICKTGFVNPVLLTQKAAQFIQVVWRETISIGVSFALGMDSRDKILCTHVVVLYKPGAIHDLKKIEENVKPGSFDAKVHCRQLSNQGGSIAQQRVAQQPITATQPNVAQQGTTVIPNAAQQPVAATQPNAAQQGTTVTPNAAQQPVGATQPNVAQQGTTVTPNAAQQPVAVPQPNVAQQGTTVTPNAAQQPVAATQSNVAQQHAAATQPNGAQQGTTVTPNAAQQPVAVTQSNIAQQGTTVTPNAAQQPVGATQSNAAQQHVAATQQNVAQQIVTATSSNIAEQGTAGAPNAAQPLTKETSPNVERQPVKATPSNVVLSTTVTPANAAQQGVKAQAPVQTTSATPENQGSSIVNIVAASSSGANSAVSNQRTPVSVPTASQTENDFEKKALEQHNIFRKRHGAESLTLDRQLCKEAKEYAKKLSQHDPEKEPQHSQQASRINQGENLFVGCNANIDSADITRIWYNEVCHYDFATYQATGAAPVGHFTQIVWKASKKFGIAREFRGDSQTGCVYVVARYNPKKTISQVVDNIDKGRFSPSVCRVERKNGKGAILTQRTELFIHDALSAHNEYRLVHGVSPLVIDKELNGRAQKYAKKLAKKSINEVEVSKTLGESVYTSCDGVVTGRSTTEAWYWDVCNYDFTLKKSKDGIADHFTQLVWKGSTKVGFGVASGIQDGKTCVFVVARYYLPGNIAGQNRYNVFKGTFNEKQCRAHALPSSQPSPASSVVLSSDGSTLNADGKISAGKYELAPAGERPGTSADGSFTSQLDKTPTDSDGTVPTVTATVTSATPSTVANKLATVNVGKEPIVTVKKPPTVTVNTPEIVTTSQPRPAASASTSLTSSKLFNTGPSRQIFGPSTTKTQPAGALVSISPPDSQPFNTGPSRHIFGPSNTKTQPVPGASSTTDALPLAGAALGLTPSKLTSTNSGKVTSTTKTQQPTSPTSTSGALPSAVTTLGPTPSQSPRPTNSGNAPSIATTQQPTTSGRTSGVLPSAGTTSGSTSAPMQTTGTGNGVAAPGLSLTPSKGILGVGTTNNQPATTTPDTGGIQPNSGRPMSVGSSSTGTAGLSKVTLGSATTKKPVITNAKQVSTPISVPPKLTSVTGSTVKKPTTAPSNTNTPSSSAITSGLPPTPASTTKEPTSGSPSTRPVNAAQNGINLNKHFYPTIEYRIGKGFVNDMDEINSDNTWPAPGSSIEMEDPNSYNEDEMDDDDMNQTFREEHLEDRKTQSNKFNDNFPTSKPDFLSAEESTDSTRIHHQMVHPWGNQHSKDHHRNQDFLTNEKYLPNKVNEGFQHDQQHKGWSLEDELGQYDDSIDSLGSEMTWDEDVKGDNGEISNTYKDLDYEDFKEVDGDFKEPYVGGHEKTYGSTKGMMSTYKDSHRNSMSMYKELDSKAYPKQSESFEDNIDISLEGNSKVLRGFQNINGVSSEGVGLPVQEYADELGQVRHIP